MDSDLIDELLKELFGTFESTETQSAAILQFLKDKGIATDEKLCPYLEQGGTTKQSASGRRVILAGNRPSNSPSASM